MSTRQPVQTVTLTVTRLLLYTCMNAQDAYDGNKGWMSDHAIKSGPENSKYRSVRYMHTPLPMEGVLCWQHTQPLPMTKVIPAHYWQYCIDFQLDCITALYGYASIVGLCWIGAILRSPATFTEYHSCVAR